jgi:glutamyl-tRNA reductase
MELWGRWLGLSNAEVEEQKEHLVVREDVDAGRHLLRVAAGLESVVLGEDQIQRQVREAYRRACAAREPGALLHRLFHAAFRAGKRVRAETALQPGGRSLAGCGAAFLAQRLDGLAGKAVLVMGAGEMGSLAARKLRDRGVGRLLVTNRTWSRAAALAEQVSGEALPWPWRAAALSRVAGVICACHAPEPVLRGAWLSAAVSRHGRLVVVDLAVPRGVERPAPIPPGLLLADLSTLAEKMRRDAERRRAAVEDAGRIVEEELHEWRNWAEGRAEDRKAVGGRLRSQAGSSDVAIR